jgi:8-oxo-dGTP pyrophosphatase MutT (NUDIX family)
VRNRAGIILIENDKLALIERHRGGMHYFIFPGGGIDEGESPEHAAVRETEEELGIKVQIKQKVVEAKFHNDIQYYFLVEKIGGEFGTGTGEEYGEYNPLYGTYHPLWMPLNDVLNNNVLPHELASVVVQFAKEGWPLETLMILNKKN